jgi:hypothetical protein
MRPVGTGVVDLQWRQEAAKDLHQWKELAALLEQLLNSAMTLQAACAKVTRLMQALREPSPLGRVVHDVTPESGNAPPTPQ